MSKATIIEVDNLVKRFKDVKALDRLSLSISHGIFGLIGPNGAGKTTLLRILLGLIQSNNGSAHVLGYDVRTQSINVRKRVGVLHEKQSFPSYLTPIEYLKHVRALYGTGLSPEDVLSLVDLFDERFRKIGSLSAGMQQRLGIAQALIPNSELVLLDEPTSNLDVTGRTEIIQSILNIHNERGTSFFITSHILSELERVCHEVAFIRNGRLLVKGPVLDIIQTYTKQRYKILCSDAKALKDALEQVSGITDITIAGANSVVIVIEEGPLEHIQLEAKDKASTKGIVIHSFEQATTLEEAYKEIMSIG